MGRSHIPGCPGHGRCHDGPQPQPQFQLFHPQLFHPHPQGEFQGLFHAGPHAQLFHPHPRFHPHGLPQKMLGDQLPQNEKLYLGAITIVFVKGSI